MNTGFPALKLLLLFASPGSRHLGGSLQFSLTCKLHCLYLCNVFEWSSITQSLIRLSDGWPFKKVTIWQIKQLSWVTYVWSNQDIQNLNMFLIMSGLGIAKLTFYTQIFFEKTQITWWFEVKFFILALVYSGSLF